jgi:hypothetical protein
MLLVFLVAFEIGMNLKPVLAEKWLLDMNQASCSEVDAYYTGKGFFDDESAMKQDYDKLAPIVMDDGVWDCEDTSHAIYCMAKLYGIKCQTYYQFSYGRPVKEWNEHVGIDCYVYGKWEWLN